MLFGKVDVRCFPSLDCNPRCFKGWDYHPVPAQPLPQRMGKDGMSDVARVAYKFKRRLQRIRALNEKYLRGLWMDISRASSPELANELYWETDIPTNILECFCLYPWEEGRLRDFIRPRLFDYTCRNGHSGIIEISSRSAYQSLKKDVTSYCPTCKENREMEWAERDQRRAEENAQREREIEFLRQLPYRDYLQTEHWQEVRRYMLKRARWRCQLCNHPGRLNVHHKTYENRGCEQLSDLIVLCQPCHAKHHDKVVA